MGQRGDRAQQLSARPPLPSTRDLPRIPWLEGEQWRLVRDLRRAGCESPTLCSDALELAGQARLGQRDPLQRREAIGWVESEEGRRALARAREARALVLLVLSPWGTREIRTVAREHFQEQRAMEVWPLWLLWAIWAKVRAEQIRLEVVEDPYHVQLRAKWQRERREARDAWRASQRRSA